MIKNIAEHLPKSGQKKKLVQGYVDADLRTRVRAKMRDQNIGWDDLMTAACRAYLGDPPQNKTKGAP